MFPSNCNLTLHPWFVCFVTICLYALNVDVLYCSSFFHIFFIFYSVDPFFIILDLNCLNLCDPLFVVSSSGVIYFQFCFSLYLSALWTLSANLKVNKFLNETPSPHIFLFEFAASLSWRVLLKWSIPVEDA